MATPVFLLTVCSIPQKGKKASGLLEIKQKKLIKDY
jgi:hypothetical protein